MRTEAGFGPGGVTPARLPPGRGGRHEPVEDRQRVERARRALGVVLDGLDRQLAVTQSLDRPVVEVDLADPEPAQGRQRVADDLDLVVLGRHLDEPELEVLDGMIGTVMAEAQASGVGAGRAPHDLVAEADPQQGPAVGDDRPGEGDLGLEPGWIARSGRQDDAVDVRATGRPTPMPCAGRPGRARRDGASPGRCSS